MSTYKPDNWVILKIDNEDETIYKVFSTWSGGYTQGNSWKLNSGVVSIEDAGNYWIIKGYSGSTYMCHKNAQGMSAYGHSVYHYTFSPLIEEGNIQIIEFNALSDIKL